MNSVSFPDHPDNSNKLATALDGDCKACVGTYLGGENSWGC